MSHPIRRIALLLAFISSAVNAATAEPPPGIIAPVIPAPGTSASPGTTTSPAPAGPDRAGPAAPGPAASGSTPPGPATPPVPESVAPTNGAGAPVPVETDKPSLSGRWQATEVIVFDRPMVGLEPKGERLLTDAPRTFPAGLQSFDTAGVGGGVVYPADPDARMCLAIAAGTVAPPDTGAPEAFTRPPATEPPSGRSETSVGAAEKAPSATGDAATAAVPQDGQSPPEPVDPRAALERALRDYEAGLEAQSLTWVPQQANPLAAQARRLVDGGGYRILFHRTWIQNLALPGPAPLVLVQADRNAVDGQAAEGASLEGTVQISGNRGLRFAARLWYRPADADPADTRYIGIDEILRLGDGQTHYIDHPKLGIIVRTTAVGIPATISEAWAALSPPAE